mmetsp:Transcript_74562/g.230442  ORF Transcript_74562/g.230442 Transcript_74562/m.230442 type:complete len:244 (+) Transcript_74562:77-808(+)
MGCMVLSGLFGIMVQGLLFLVCIGTLLVKWRIEVRHKIGIERSFLVFCLDGSKQLAGAGWLHATNLIFATVLTFFVGKGDQCEWYWINIMMDTTLGSLVAYGLLRLVNCIIKKGLGDEKSRDWVRSGHYYEENKFRWGMFLKQAFVWVVLVVTLMKTFMVCLMVAFHMHFLKIASFILHPFLHNDNLKLLVVMIITPGVMNAFQFVVVDNIIKLTHRKVQHNGIDEHLTGNKGGPAEVNRSLG